MDMNTVRLKVANITDIGRNPARTVNEDYYGHFEGEYGNLFIVCDGMGGHEAGEVASRLTVESIKAYFASNYISGEEADTIGKSIDFAQKKILEQVRENPEMASMGTTLVLLLIQGVNYWIAHSGDSRIYLSRGGSLNQLTRDHSEVEQLVQSGAITREQAATHPRRNYITKAIGHTNYLPDVAGPYILNQDDVFLLCSDGLTEYVKEGELLQQMDEEPAIACRNLVDIANERGGDDNITLQVVQVVQCSPFSMTRAIPEEPRKGLKLHLFLVLTVVVFLAAVIWYVISIQRIPKDAPAAPPATPKVVEQKVAPAKPAAPKNADLEKQFDAKLGASAAPEAYQKYFASITKSQPGLSLKFISKAKKGQVVYMLPGQAVYLDFAALGTKDGKNYPLETLHALIALAVAQCSELASPDAQNWESELSETGTAAISEQTWNKARDLYLQSNAKNAATDGTHLFAAENRFGKFKKLLKAGAYSFTLAE